MNIMTAMMTVSTGKRVVYGTGSVDQFRTPHISSQAGCAIVCRCVQAATPWRTHDGPTDAKLKNMSVARGVGIRGRGCHAENYQHPSAVQQAWTDAPPRSPAGRTR